MKFGGTSVADLNIMRNAILKIVEEVKNKKKVIVVVSAMGSTTDNLVRKIKEASNNGKDEKAIEIINQIFLDD